MSDERFLTLIDGYLSEELTESESEELFQLIQKDSNRRAYFTSQLQTSRGLDFLSQPANDAAIVESVLSMIAQNGSRDQRVADEVMKKIVRRANRRRAKRDNSRGISWLGLSTAAVLVMSVCAWMFANPQAKDSLIVVTVESFEGNLDLIRAGKKIAIFAGEKIYPDEELKCGEGGAILRFADGSRATAGSYSSLTLKPANGAKEFYLNQGSLIVDAVPQPASHPFLIRTPHAEIKLVGTVVHVGVSIGVTRLQVDEGRVKMRSAQENSTESLIVAGKTGIVNASDSHVRLEDSAYSSRSVKLQAGLWGEYFKDPAFADMAIKRVDGPIQFNWGMSAPISGMPKEDFSVRWSGYLVPEASDDYSIHALCDDSVRIWLENEKGQLVLLIDRWTRFHGVGDSATIRLRAGALHRIRVDYKQDKSYAIARLGWSTPTQPEAPIPLSCMKCSPDGPRALMP